MASGGSGSRSNSPVPDGGHGHSKKQSDKHHHHHSSKDHHNHHSSSKHDNHHHSEKNGGHVHMHDGRGGHSEAHKHGYESDAYQIVSGESHRSDVAASHKSGHHHHESHKHPHVNPEYFHPHTIKTIERDEKDPFRIAEEEALAEMERARHRHHHSSHGNANDDSSDDEVVVVHSKINTAPPRKRRSVHSTKPNLLRKEIADQSAKANHDKSHKSGKGSSKKANSVSPAPAVPAATVSDKTDLAKGRRNGVGDRVMT